MKKGIFALVGAALLLASGFMFTGCGDDDDDEPAAMTLEVTLNEVEADSITVTYSDSKNKSINRIVGADVSNGKATVTIEKLADWIKIRDLTGTKDNVSVSLGLVSEEGNNDYFEFKEDQTVTVKVGARDEKDTMTVNLVFSDFTPAKVEVKYGNAEDINEDTPTTTPATASKESDGNFTVSVKNVSFGGAIRLWEVNAYESEDATEATEIEFSANSNTERGAWFTFSKDSSDVTITYTSKQEKIDLVSGKTNTASESSVSTPVQIVEASAFADKEIAKLIITVTDSSNVEWVTFTTGENWDQKIEDVLKQSDKTVSTSSKTFIDAVKANGLYVACDNNKTVTISIKYVEGEPVDDTVEEVTYNYNDTPLFDGSSAETTFTGELSELVSKNLFEGVSGTILAVKIVTTNYTVAADGEWWITIDTGTNWSDDKISLNDSGKWDNNGWTYELTGDALAKYLNSGLYIAGYNTATAKVSVYYSTETSE